MAEKKNTPVEPTGEAQDKTLEYDLAPGTTMSVVAGNDVLYLGTDAKHVTIVVRGD